MSMIRNLSCGMALVALAGTAIAAPQPKDAATTADTAERGARLQHQYAGTTITGDFDLVFDNLTDADSSAEVNVAYTDAGSYDGTSTSTNASLFGMTSTPGALFDAPDPGTGIPTDIVWDEYAVDLDAWGGPSGTMQTLTQIDFVPVIVNDDGVDGDRTLQILFFNFDGDTFMGGVNLTYSVPFDYAGWFDDSIDLLGNALEFDAMDVGYIMYDWVNVPDVGTDAGLGMMIAGGDLLDPTFPLPEDQWTLGETDPTTWLAADAETNVDPDFDGEPDVSYIDILNTGDLWNWGFVDDPGGTPTSELAHDFPFRLYAQVDGGTTCPEDLDGDGDIDLSDLGILLAAFNVDDGGDINGDGVTDLSDLGALLALFGGPCP
jgi:hypothetical protein